MLLRLAARVDAFELDSPDKSIDPAMLFELCFGLRCKYSGIRRLALMEKALFFFGLCILACNACC